MSRVRPFAMYDVEAVLPARRYRSRPGSALDPVNSLLSPSGLQYVLRTGASCFRTGASCCRGRLIAKDRKDSIGVRSRKRVYVTARAGARFIWKEGRMMAGIGR